MVEWFVFLVGGAVCVAGAIGVIASKNSVHSALSLVGTLFGIAVLFVAQDAEFLAAVQVIVYAGSIIVLFLFVIMLLGVDRTEEITVDPLTGQRTAGIIAGVLLFVGLGTIIALGAVTGAPSATAEVDLAVPNVEQIAREIFTDYIFAFEITSVLLIIAVVGAVSLARLRRDAFVDDVSGDDLPESDEVTA